MRYHFPDSFGNCLIIVIISAQETEKHISPHNALKTVLLCYFGNLFKVIKQYIKPVFKAVNVLIFSASQHMRLVHSYVNDTGSHGLFE